MKHPMVENLNQILISKIKHVSSLQIDPQLEPWVRSMEINKNDLIEHAVDFFNNA